MYRHILVPLLESIILFDVMKVIPTNNNCTLHFHFLHHSGQYSAANGNVAGERTFLIDIGSFNRLNEQ